MRKAALEWAAERAARDAQYNNRARIKGEAPKDTPSDDTELLEVMVRELAREMFEEYEAVYNFDMGDR